MNMWLEYHKSFPSGSVVKNPPANAGDVGWISGPGRSPGEGNNNPLQYSCLENPMARGAWRTTVHKVTKSQTQLSDWVTCRLSYTKKLLGCDMPKHGNLLVKILKCENLWRGNKPGIGIQRGWGIRGGFVVLTCRNWLWLWEQTLRIWMPVGH